MIQPDAHYDIPSPYYRVSLKALVFDASNRILVLQTEDGFWELPGGGWEHGESMQDCIRREIIEELGVGVKDINFTTMYPYSSKGRSGHMRLKLAVEVITDGTDFVFGDDIKEHKFVTASELSGLEMVDSEAGIKAHISRIWPS